MIFSAYAGTFPFISRKLFRIVLCTLHTRGTKDNFGMRHERDSIKSRGNDEDDVCSVSANFSSSVHQRAVDY